MSQWLKNTTCGVVSSFQLEMTLPINSNRFLFSVHVNTCLLVPQPPKKGESKNLIVFNWGSQDYFGGINFVTKLL